MSDETPRTLRDYRPQHADRCKSRDCAQCGHSMSHHREYGGRCQALKRHDGDYPVQCGCKGEPFSCNCGLDALLAPSLPPTVEEAREALAQDIYSLSEPRSDSQRVYFRKRAMTHLDALLAAQRHASAQEIERLTKQVAALTGPPSNPLPPTETP